MYKKVLLIINSCLIILLMCGCSKVENLSPVLGQSSLKPLNDVSETNTLFEQKLETYCRLLVEDLANIQKDDVILLILPIDAAPLASKLTEYGYKSGAKAVYLFYSDADYNAIQAQYLSPDKIKEYLFPLQGAQALVENNQPYVFIRLLSPKFTESAKTTAEQKNTYTNAMLAYLKTIPDYKAGGKGRTTWTIAAYPNSEWAKKVYPELAPEEALAAFWQDIFDFSGISDENSKESSFIQNKNELMTIRDKINSMEVSSLHFKSQTADLVVDLHPNNKFSGVVSDYKGRKYFPNIPTEEIFGMPHKYSVNGTVVSTMPLILDGMFIEEMKLEFKDGKIVQFSAAKGEEVLRNFLERDENNRYLGEVSIVPYNSPIGKKERLYYEALLDENASCHLAFGNSYSENLKDGFSRDNNSNSSDDHIDFMIGSKDVVVTATLKDGSKVELIRDGNWTSILQ